ncbi:MAG: hypothetical protein JWR38_629 [Mucilaginibacter sp.]|nr:hypothetical protein [Mucilaginibacter sp.]
MVDYSQVLKPYWQQAANYKRFTDQVIEIPIDPSSVKLSTALGNSASGSEVYKKEYSRSSFLLLNDGQGYKAYIMTIIADPSYLKNDLSKLDHNKYNKRDSDFTGAVVYSTPKGKFVSTWFYKNGHITSSMPSQPVQPTDTVNNNDPKKIQSLKPNLTRLDCTDWYQISTDSNGTVISVTYLGSDCAYNVISDSGGGDGGNGGGGGAGSTPSTPPPPLPCVVPNSLKVQSTGGHFVVYKNVVQPPPGDGDGTYPPPTTPPPPVPCPVAAATITNNVIDPCLKGMVNTAVSKNITFSLNESMNSIFNSNTNFNLNFRDAVGSTFSEPTIDGTTDVDFVHFTNINSRRVIDAMDLIITLNKTGLSNASQEFVTATIMHEALHAYLSYSQTIVNQHMDMARNYISVMTDQLLKLYPNLTPNDAKDLAWGGLETDAGDLYTSLSQEEKNRIEITNKSYKSGNSGNPCTR